MLETKHHYLPLFLAFYLPLSFVITHSIAVAYDHVKPGFPYISNTGTFPSESCVFGQLLNIGAVISGMIVYIRYRHVIHLHGNKLGRRGLLNLNTASFIVGLVTTLGVSLVGNFQFTNAIVVHLIGSILAILIGFVYGVMQTIISYKMSGFSENPGNTLNMRRFRIVLCIIDFTLLIGFAEYLASTISEWLIVVVFVVYFGTYYHEFKHFRVQPVTIVLYDSTVLKDGGPEINVSTLSTHM